MRVILFRGKDIYGKWLYGDLINLTEDIKQICNHSQLEHAHSVNTETVGQYTGLTDKNGKKIYEGDILRYTLDGDVYTYACFWDDGNCEFGLKNEKRDFGLAYAPRDIEVIGNIQDNPELLKGGEG